ncbi:MAG: methyltransferase domain-containing protein [Verrucomicrobiota bacterium]
MNYGFADPDGEPLPLKEADESDRYFIQLYHHVATAVDLSGRKVLEVGSGRGGGANYVARCLGPDSVTGLDYSANAVAFCKEIYRAENLTFREGDAESLRFGDDSFDVVLNVESSHCYGSMDAFCREVFRVLKPGGFFSWADLREVGLAKKLEGQFEAAGFEIESQTDITPQVLHALDLITETKQEAINNMVPRILRPAFRDFAAVKDSKVYTLFKDRNWVYSKFLLRKP